MAIKDSLISSILKSEATPAASHLLYKRLKSYSGTTSSNKTKHTPNTEPSESLDTTQNTDDQEIKWEQTGNKLATNRQQSGNKINNKLATNWQQTDNKNDYKKQTGNKLASQPTTEPTTNWQQTGNKLATKTSFSMLVGLQRNCLIFVYQSCKANRSRVTEPLSLEHIAQYIKARTGTIKTTLQRLVEKNCLIRTGFKNGRGGWATFEIPDDIFTEILRQETDNKVATKWQQTDNKVASQPTTEPATSLSSSSSILNINKTTTTNDPVVEVMEGIDYQALSSIGFNGGHLRQIVQRSGLTREMIQDSINAFAFDLKKNNLAAKTRTPPLNYFMGTITKGSPYNPPDNYESPQQESLRKYLESKEAATKKDQELKERAISLSFEEWKNSLCNEKTINEIKQGIDPMLKKIDAVVEGKILEYYRENIWPLDKERFLAEIGQGDAVIAASL